MKAEDQSAVARSVDAKVRICHSHLKVGFDRATGNWRVTLKEFIPMLTQVPIALLEGDARRSEFSSWIATPCTDCNKNIAMKITRSKKLRRLMQEVDPRTEPRVVAVLLRAARRLPVVRFKKVLTTTDFSVASMEGVRFAVSFADKLGATLTLVHVIEPGVLARVDAEVMKLAEMQVTNLAAQVSIKNLAVTLWLNQTFGNQAGLEIVTRLNAFLPV